MLFVNIFLVKFLNEVYPSIFCPIKSVIQQSLKFELPYLVIRAGRYQKFHVTIIMTVNITIIMTVNITIIDII